MWSFVIIPMYSIGIALPDSAEGIERASGERVAMVTRDLGLNVDQRSASASAIEPPVSTNVARAGMVTNLLGMFLLVVLFSAYLVSGA